MRVAVTGREGQVAQALAAAGPLNGHEVIAVGRPGMDLAVAGSVLPALAAARPDVIVSAAAYTAVDRAESEPELAFLVNALGAGAVAEAAAVLGVPVIHLSTDYVFDGTKTSPYVETDPVGPASAYGASKLEGERRVAAAVPNHAILRTAWVYSPQGGNFVKTMLRLGETRDELGVVGDQRGCPTAAADIAASVLEIAARMVADPDPALRGIFHLTGSGEASWAEFATEIFRLAEQHGRSPVRVRTITTADYPTPARRPANSRLSGAKFEKTFGIRLPEWRLSTARVVEQLLGKDKELYR